MTEESIIPFGKHKGKPLKEVPESWFIYMHDRGKLSGEIKKYAEENVNILRFVVAKKATRKNFKD